MTSFFTLDQISFLRFDGWKRFKYFYLKNSRESSISIFHGILNLQSVLLPEDSTNNFFSSLLFPLQLVLQLRKIGKNNYFILFFCQTTFFSLSSFFSFIIITIIIITPVQKILLLAREERRERLSN